MPAQTNPFVTHPVLWSDGAQPVGVSLDQLLYRVRQHDTDGLIFDAVSLEDFLEDAETLILDALTTTQAKLTKQVRIIERVLKTAGRTLNVVSSQISDPFKRQGVVNVAAIFELSDGQTLSILFHNPDAANVKSLKAGDTLISWKWLLNKRDITIVVAPEKGVDQPVRQIAARVMKLAEKNSAAFARINRNRAERMERIDGLRTEIAELETQLDGLRKDISVAMQEKDDRDYELAQRPMRALTAIERIKGFLGLSQYRSMVEALNARETAASEADKALALAELIDTMAVRFEQQDKGTEATAYLRYQQGSAEHYITERDNTGDGTEGARGWIEAIRDIGDINIRNIVNGGGTLDLGFRPAVLSSVVDVSEPQPEPEPITIPDDIQQELLAPFQRIADALARARQTDQQFNGGGRYAAEAWLNMGAEVALQEAESRANKRIAAITDENKRAAAQAFLTANKPDVTLSEAEQEWLDGLRREPQPEPQPDDDKAVWHKGEKIQLTGKIEDGFEEFVYLTGHKQGETGVRLLANEAEKEREKRNQETEDARIKAIRLANNPANDQSGIPMEDRLAFWRAQDNVPDSVRAEFERRGMTIDQEPTEENDTLTPEGADNLVKTAKGTQVMTGFTVVEADSLIASHDAQGNPNPAYPAELQPRDRSRDASIAWVKKTAQQLDPDSLGRTRRADSGAPIVGPDGVVESGNGRTMAIQEAYRAGTAEEYRQWLIEEAETYKLNPEKIRGMRAPVLVRVRTSDIDRRTFAVEANQDDKLAMTGTEKARADADRIDDGLLAKLADDGDLLSAANRSFLMGFLQSLGDAEAAQYMTSDGKPTGALVQRVQSALFAKAYSDDRLLELTADASKPEIANIVSALNIAAPEFVRARAADAAGADALTEKVADSVQVSLNDQAVQSIIEATNLVRKARAEGQSIDEVVAQRGLFGDIDPTVAAMAVFISKNNRSGKRLGVAFKAMAEFVRKEAERGQTVDMFGDSQQTSLKEIIAAANRELDRLYGEGEFAIDMPDLFSGGGPEPEPEPGPTPEPTNMTRVDSKTLVPGDTVYLYWLATKQWEPVDYRGPLGDDQAVVVKDGIQMTVPMADLRGEPEISGAERAALVASIAQQMTDGDPANAADVIEVAANQINPKNWLAMVGSGIERSGAKINDREQFANEVLAELRRMAAEAPEPTPEPEPQTEPDYKEIGERLKSKSSQDKVSVSPQDLVDLNLTEQSTDDDIDRVIKAMFDLPEAAMIANRKHRTRSAKKRVELAVSQALFFDGKRAHQKNRTPEDAKVVPKNTVVTSNSTMTSVNVDQLQNATGIGYVETNKASGNRTYWYEADEQRFRNRGDLARYMLKRLNEMIQAGQPVNLDALSEDRFVVAFAQEEPEPTPEPALTPSAEDPQTQADRALLQSVIDGTVADMLSLELGAQLMAIYERHGGEEAEWKDPELKRLAEAAMDAYQKAMMDAEAPLA